MLLDHSYFNERNNKMENNISEISQELQNSIEELKIEDLKPNYLKNIYRLMSEYKCVIEKKLYERFLHIIELTDGTTGCVVIEYMNIDKLFVFKVAKEGMLTIGYIVPYSVLFMSDEELIKNKHLVKSTKELGFYDNYL